MNLRSSWSLILFSITACSSNEASPRGGGLVMATATSSLETRSAPEGTIERRSDDAGGVAGLPGFSISQMGRRGVGEHVVGR
jgi:hypothetical protein